MIKMDDSKNNIYKILLEVQKELNNLTIPKDGYNPYFNSEYTTLFTLLNVIKPVLNKHGILLYNKTYFIEQKLVKVETILHYTETGEELKGEFTSVPKDLTPQGIGAAETYGRRYSLMSLLGLISSEEDDDGNKASFDKNHTNNHTNNHT
ncbi:MAG TPA: ERF family protein, partial [archaeon]|nr:ERF family protein [archaeon]